MSPAVSAFSRTSHVSGSVRLEADCALAIRDIVSCKLKLGVETRDADIFA
jgi:hypothetical protein